MADVADAGRAARSRGVGTGDGDSAFSGFREAGEDAQQRGFARAVAAEQGEAGAAGDLQRDIAQGRKIAEVLPDAAQRRRALLAFGLRSSFGGAAR